MTLKVQKWGNSLAVRIPKLLAKEAKLREGTPIEVSGDETKIVLQKAEKIPKYSLRELVDQITPENMQPYISDGGPVGKERFWENE